MPDPTYYDITKTDGTSLVSVPIGTKNETASSITLLGPNVPNYGEFLNENQVHMLEHFAGTSAPGSLPLDSILKRPPIKGQVWFDTDDTGPFTSGTTIGRLKVYDGTSWLVIADGNDLVLEKSERTNANASMLTTINSHTTLISGKVNKAGDIMTNFLTLNADPVSDLHAATKKYVDNRNIKVIAYVDDIASNANFVSAVLAGTGIATITRVSPGNYSITFINSFIDTNYSVSVKVHNNSIGSWWSVDEGTRQVNSYSFTTVKFNGSVSGVPTNSSISIQIFGK